MFTILTVRALLILRDARRRSHLSFQDQTVAPSTVCNAPNGLVTGECSIPLHVHLRLINIAEKRFRWQRHPKSNRHSIQSLLPRRSVRRKINLPSSNS